MPKKETGVPNLDKYLGERQRTLCNYEQGARMYGVPYYTFVNLCKEAGASFKVKRTAIVDLDKLDAYIEELGAEEMERREQSRIMNSRSKSDKLAELAKSGKKKFVRYDEGAQLYSMGVHMFAEMAKEAGAVYKIRHVCLVNLDIFEEYLATFKEDE